MNSTRFDHALADELRTIGLEFERIFELEREAASELDSCFAEQQSSIDDLVISIQAMKAAGQWRKSRFNLFEVLGRTRHERSHSSFLAWLLDPAESHGLGGAFLREFMLKSVENEPPSFDDLKVSPEFPFGGGILDIHVRGTRWCLIVENKVDAFAGVDQFDKYHRHCELLKERGESAWLVYVTPGAQPPSKHWVTYRDIRKMLEQILESSTPPSPARMIIEQFCEHVFADLEP
jgi:hypothetical protein